MKITIDTKKLEEAINDLPVAYIPFSCEDSNGTIHNPIGYVTQAKEIRALLDRIEKGNL